MRIFTTALILLIIASMNLFSNVSWNYKTNKEILFPLTSPDGSFFMFTQENDDNFDLILLDAASGKELWRKTLTKLDKEKIRISRFVNDNTVLTGTGNEFLFLDTKTGNPVKSLKLVCESWEDMIWKVDSKYPANSKLPFFEGKFAILGGPKGFHIINMEKMEMLYQTAHPGGYIDVKDYNGVWYITAFAGTAFSFISDSVYLFDKNKEKMILAAERKSSNIGFNSRLYQSMAADENRIIINCENSIVFINRANGSIETSLSMNPNEFDFYGIASIDKELKIMTSGDDIQSFYSGTDGKLLWKTDKDKIKGEIAEVYQFEPGKFLLISIDQDNTLNFNYLDSKNGSVIWQKPVIELDGKYSAGFQRGGIAEGLVKTLALSVISAVMSSGSGFTYRPNLQWVQQSLNHHKVAAAYIKAIDMNSNNVTFVTYGKGYDLLSGKKGDEENGEMVFTLNYTNGEINNKQYCTLFKDNKESNVYNILQPQYFKAGILLPGLNEIDVLMNGKIEKISMNNEYEIIDLKENEFIVKNLDKDNDVVQYSKFSANGSKIEKTILALTTDKKYFRKTDFFEIKHCLKIDEDSVAAIALKPGTEIKMEEFSNPLWSIKFDEFAIGDIDINKVNKKRNAAREDNPYYDYDGFLHGIQYQKDFILFGGSKGIGFAKNDGSCKWFKEWDPDLKETLQGVSYSGNKIFYSTGSNTKVYSLDCKGETDLELDSRYGYVNYNIGPNRLIITNNEDGIYGINLK